MIGPFPRKISRFACNLTTFWIFEQLCTNAVEMRLGLTGALAAQAGKALNSFAYRNLHNNLPLILLTWPGNVRWSWPFWVAGHWIVPSNCVMGILPRTGGYHRVLCPDSIHLSYQETSVPFSKGTEREERIWTHLLFSLSWGHFNQIG